VVFAKNAGCIVAASGMPQKQYVHPATASVPKTPPAAIVRVPLRSGGARLIPRAYRYGHTQVWRCTKVCRGQRTSHSGVLLFNFCQYLH